MVPLPAVYRACATVYASSADTGRSLSERRARLYRLYPRLDLRADGDGARVRTPHVLGDPRELHGFVRLREIRFQHNGQMDLRTAAFVDAIDKIAICYQDLGIFP